MFHTFIEYLRLLHQDCNQFDTVSTDDLDDLIPYSYDPTYKGGNTTLDYVMDYSVLCDETGGKKKAMCSERDITPRFGMKIYFKYLQSDFALNADSEILLFFC